MSSFTEVESVSSFTEVDSVSSFTEVESVSSFAEVDSVSSVSFFVDGRVLVGGVSTGRGDPQFDVSTEADGSSHGSVDQLFPSGDLIGAGEYAGPLGWELSFKRFRLNLFLSTVSFLFDSDDACPAGEADDFNALLFIFNSSAG